MREGTAEFRTTLEATGGSNVAIDVPDECTTSDAAGGCR